MFPQQVSRMKKVSFWFCQETQRNRRGAWTLLIELKQILYLHYLPSLKDYRNNKKQENFVSFDVSSKCSVTRSQTTETSNITRASKTSE